MKKMVSWLLMGALALGTLTGCSGGGKSREQGEKT